MEGYADPPSADPHPSSAVVESNSSEWMLPAQQGSAGALSSLDNAMEPSTQEYTSGKYTTHSMEANDGGDSSSLTAATGAVGSVAVARLPPLSSFANNVASDTIPTTRHLATGGQVAATEEECSAPSVDIPSHEQFAAVASTSFPSSSDTSDGHIAATASTTTSPHVADDDELLTASSEQQYRDNDVFLSLNNPVYRDLMFEHYRKLQLTATRDDERETADEILLVLKRGGGGCRFFRNARKNVNVEGPYLEVDETYALKSKFIYII